MSLVFEDVTKSFDGTDALSGLNLSIDTGQLMTVLGPSGGGKTTMLRLAAGLETPTRGNVMLDGARVELGDASVAFQDTPLYPHLSVMDNVLFPLRLKAARKGSGRASQDAAREVLEMMRIPDLGRRRIHQLSGGQKQRVGIARALVRDVGLYLFDEPLAHLDQALAREIREDLHAIQRETGLTMLYVTHQVEEAFALGDTVAVLHNGRLEHVGTPQEVWQRPANRFVAGFLGSYPMNFLETDDGPVLGFRPENCRILAGDEGSDCSRGSVSTALSLDVRITAESFLGDTTLVAVEGPDSAGGPLRALVPSGPDERPRIGERARLVVARGHLHEFDRRTGERIG